MSNDYFEYDNLLEANSLARSGAVNQRFQAVETAFEQLPAKVKLQQSRVTFIAVTGTNSLAGALDTSPGSYAAGLRVGFVVANTNSGAATLNLNGLGATAIKRFNGADLSAGDLTAGQVVELLHDGTNFVLGSASSAGFAAAASAGAAAASAVAAAASAASIDPAGFVHIAGSETITGAKTFSAAIAASAGITINGQTLSGLTAAGKTLAEAADAAAQRTALSVQPTANPTFTGTLTAATVAASGAVKSSGASGGIGYATGAGSSVTQTTSKATNVNVTGMCGQITLNNASLANNTTVGFRAFNAAIGVNDMVYIWLVSGATGSSANYQLWAAANGGGEFVVNVRNISGGSLSDALVIGWFVIRVVTS
jgi:hypothetical protein